MDRMIHTALNSLKMILQNQQITSQNISNASVVGYRKDSNSEFGSAYLNGEDQLNSRVFATRQIGAFSNQQGELESTENPLDVAIKGNGFFIIQPKEGDIALSRRGDFSLNQEGQLKDGDGNLVLGNDLQPILIPAFRRIEISSEGEIRINPLEAPLDAPLQLIATLGSNTGEELDLEKGPDGIIRPKAELDDQGQENIPGIEATGKVSMVNKFLEKSNVNPIEELIMTLEHQRNYETHVKFIDLAKQMDEGGASLMRVPD
tara:strand:+ start:819 stop:1601 length:783 start_codon:yes stop_codon:yes gene_type:complete